MTDWRVSCLRSLLGLLPLFLNFPVNTSVRPQVDMNKTDGMIMVIVDKLTTSACFIARWHKAIELLVIESEVNNSLSLLIQGDTLYPWLASSLSSN